MLIDNYKDKIVKIVVSSQSGAGISLGDMTRGGTLSTTITIIGKISAYDDEYIEVEKAQMLSANIRGKTPVIGDKGIDDIKIDNCESMLVSKSKIISILLINE